MASLKEIRQKFPQYNDLNDEQLVSAFHQKFYSDIPRDVFNERLGYTPPDPMADAGEQFVRGINRGVNAVVSLPGEIVGGAADLMGFEGDRFRWNNPVSEFMTSVDRPPQTTAGRVATASGEAIGASALPYAGIQSQAARLATQVPRTTVGAIAQRIAQPMASAPVSTAALEATSAATGGAAAQGAAELGHGPLGQTVAGIAGGMAPGALVAGTAGVRRGIQRAREVQGQRGAYTKFVERLPGTVDDLSENIAAGAGPIRPERSLALRILGEEMERNGGNVQIARLEAANRLARELPSQTGQRVTPQQASQIIVDLEQSQARNPLFIGEQPSVMQGDEALRTPSGQSLPADSIDENQLRQYRQSGTRQLYDYLATSPSSEVSVPTLSALDDRAMELRGTFRDMVARHLPQGPNGQPLGLEDIDNMIDNMTQAAGRAYAQTTQQPINYAYRDRVFPAMMRRWERAANARAGAAGAAIRRAIEGFRTPDGQPVQTLRQLQDARTELRLLRESAIQNGDRTFVEVTRPIYEQVTRMMRTMSPAWSRANDLWRDMSFIDMANRFGQGFTRRASPQYREDLAEFRRLAPQAQNVVRVQVMQQLFDQLENVSDPYRIGRFFENPQIRTVVRDLFGSEAVNDFTRVVRDINVAEKTFNMNSMTQPRQALAREMTRDQDAVAAADLMSIKGIRQWATNRLRDMLVMGRDRPLQELMTTRVRDIPQTAQQLERLRQQNNRLARFARPDLRGRSSGVIAVPGTLATIGENQNAP